VYVFHANGYPFYVGHGHDARLSDRPVYVDRLVRLHSDRTYYKWKLHGKVIADLWQARVEVYFDQISSGQTKAEAAAQENELLRELLGKGFLMSNDAGNPGVHPHEEIVADIRACSKRWEFLEDHKYKPVNRYVRPTRR
jgi:uncharacterized protein YktB (UPF0637 family)